MKIKSHSIPRTYISTGIIDGVNQYPIDHYPEKDCYIPEASVLASRQFPNKASNDWSVAFLSAMDSLLSKAGLRVL